MIVRAHIFQIDPVTKKSWKGMSTQALPVSFYHDTGRKIYRIICVDGTKALINTTLTAGMTTNKTSPKFCQYTDQRAGTVYGLGFPSEAEMVQVCTPEVVSMRFCDPHSHSLRHFLWGSSPNSLSCVLRMWPR